MRIQKGRQFLNKQFRSFFVDHEDDVAQIGRQRHFPDQRLGALPNDLRRNQNPVVVVRWLCHLTILYAFTRLRLPGFGLPWLAASRDPSDEEIKPVLKLKHQEIAEFTEKHGVNLEWLLEGRGRIFKKDPIRLGPNSTGAEFAAVVATMPMADQQAITAMVREMTQERNH